MDSAATAFRIWQDTGTPAVFNLATRDMNKIAIETHLLGAQALGLRNVVCLQGDPPTAREQGRFTAVYDFTATKLIAAVRGLNAGRDYLDRERRDPTDFCIGAAIDLSRGLDREVQLARRRVAAGAHFFITQPIFAAAEHERFLEGYEQAAGERLSQPVLWGLQILAKDGPTFSAIPEPLTRQLEAGRDGIDIALEVYEGFKAAGIRGVYLVPPILRGGARDYAAAQRLLSAIR
jgi:homocysteine S-methyltransferase